jgi:hypothetical protein
LKYLNEQVAEAPIGYIQRANEAAAVKPQNIGNSLSFEIEDFRLSQSTKDRIELFEKQIQSLQEECSKARGIMSASIAVLQKLENELDDLVLPH